MNKEIKKLDIEKLFGGKVKLTPIHYENPVKELFEYGEAVERGRKIRREMENAREKSVN